jgi:transposase InsO family protein
LKDQHSIVALCQTFGVSTSGYYDWCQRQSQPGPRAQEDGQLRAEVVRIHRESRQTYGAPRIVFCLRQTGRRHGRNRIARLMRQEGIWGRQRRRYRIRTTDSRHGEPVAPNRLAEQPAPQGPNQIWVADITYVKTHQGWVYVAGILDLYSRRVVGWAVGSQINTALVLAALQMALRHRRPRTGLIFHSDRGVQYASVDYRRALSLAEAVASMSRKGNCYDNAVMEAFWSTLKLEMIYRQEFDHESQVRQEVFEYIEVFYNRQRLHSALGYKTPVDFECASN